MLFMAVHEKVKKIYGMRLKSAIATPKQSLIREHHKGRILFYLFFFLHWHLIYSTALSFIIFYCQRN